MTAIVIVLWLLVSEERQILFYKPTAKMGILIRIMEDTTGFVQSDLVTNFQPQRNDDAVNCQVIWQTHSVCHANVNAIHLKENYQISCVAFFKSKELKMVDAIYWDSKDSSDQIHGSALIQSLNV